jgi:hypothetical protein
MEEGYSIIIYLLVLQNLEMRFTKVEHLFGIYFNLFLEY